MRTFLNHHIFSVIKKDDVLKVIGNPKLAHLDQFPEFSVSEDGNYYGSCYEVGNNIPEGMYLVLLMDIKEGKLSCGGNAEPSGGSHIGAPCTRFRYMILVDNGDDDKGSYLELDNCMLIPIENKPAINPIPHEDIGYKNRTTIDLLAVLLGKKTETARDHYSQLVYAQGDYIIGEDLLLGTYQIQCEIAGVISDRDSKEYQSDYKKNGSASITGVPQKIHSLRLFLNIKRINFFCGRMARLTIFPTTGRMNNLS